MRNKYRKKIIFIIMSIFMCFQVITVYGENKNVMIDKHVLKNGHVEVLLKIDEEANCLGGNFVFVYNNEKLSIDNIKYNADQDMYIVANSDYKKEGNKIKLSFASSEVIKGNIAVITFINKEKNIDENDITIQQCKVSDENGELNTAINETTIETKITEGNSIVDKSMKDIDESTKVLEKNTKKETKKENNDTKKEKTGNDSNAYIIGFILIVILLMRIVYRKYKKKF